MLQKITLAAGALILVLALTPPLAFAGGNIGNGGNKTKGYHCKSGKIVKGPQALQGKRRPLLAAGARHERGRHAGSLFLARRERPDSKTRRAMPIA